MATLDDRFLNGPNVGYCSSSDEDEPSPRPAAEGGSLAADPRAGPKTGPKGVLADYRQVRDLEHLKQKEKERLLMKDAARFSLTGKKDDTPDDEDELEAIRKRRLEHIKNMNRAKIVEIPDKDGFLQVIENTKAGSSAVIHIYRDSLEATQTLNEALLDLANETKNVNYYKVRASALDMTKEFNQNALPTLQIYRCEALMGNFIRITDQLSEDFGVADLKELLYKNDITLPFSE